ncbi:peptidoglycan-binding domain-containing protein [Sinorhizobium meliloti]|uniref:peptidoglycan-binding domain-containing protein n=1 Tax=Rhizobium meliloti TaxID=382 RepID=UPI003D6561D4
MWGVGITRPLIAAIVAATGKPRLKRGARGEDVRIVQRKVAVEEDGKYGPGTEAAVRAFQRVCDIVGDGIVGPKTWALILA